MYRHDLLLMLWWRYGEADTDEYVLADQQSWGIMGVYRHVLCRATYRRSYPEADTDQYSRTSVLLFSILYSQPAVAVLT